MEIIVNPDYLEAMAPTIFAAHYYSEYVKHEIFMPYGNTSGAIEAWYNEMTRAEKGEGDFGKASTLLGMLFQALGPCEYAELQGSGGVGGQPFDPDQQALVALAKEAQRKGVTVDEAETLLEWAQEYNVYYHPIRAHPSRQFKLPHIRIGPVNHIPVKMR